MTVKPDNTSIRMTFTSGFLSLKTAPRVPLILLLFLLLAGCSSPQWQSSRHVKQQPQWQGDTIVVSDGYRLPIKSFLAESANGKQPWASVIALHGFNDYSHAFEGLCQYVSKQGVDCYAYDQRGFGQTEGRGLWPKGRELQRDLLESVRLLRQRLRQQGRAGEPVYLLGESMGGAVVITAASEYADELRNSVSGLILYAPAVWARHTQPWYQRAALWMAVHMAPGWKPTGKGLGIVASDNREALIAMGKDPLIIKATRIDTIYGLTNLMDEALRDSLQIPLPTLVLYGKQDQVIPKVPVCEMMANLARRPIKQDLPPIRLAYYQNGYHMLTRDLGAATTFADIVGWMKDRRASLVSGNELASSLWQEDPCALY